MVSYSEIYGASRPSFLHGGFVREREGGSSTCISASGISARVSMAKGRVPVPNCNEFSKAKATH